MTRFPAIALLLLCLALPARAGEKFTFTFSPRARQFYVSLKSGPDQKAIEAQLPEIAEKYQSVLGGVPISVRTADYGAGGMSYRIMAGPLQTEREAMDLCLKIKGLAADKACFVTN